MEVLLLCALVLEASLPFPSDGAPLPAGPLACSSKLLGGCSCSALENKRCGLP